MAADGAEEGFAAVRPAGAPLSPTMDARALWIVGRDRAELRLERLARRASDEILVSARASAISRGTEALVFHGRVPESERIRMRCPFQAGDFPWPVKYGYASVGVVEDGPATLRGRRVFCLHPHQDRYVVAADAVVPVPDGVSDARAALAANMETALNGLWDGAPGPGDRIAVVGAGLVGLLIGLLASRIPGARVEIVEPDPARAALARDLGIALGSGAPSDSEADVVFHASGSPDGLVSALGLAGFEAKVIEMSWFGDRPVTLPLGHAFHAKRLAIVSSQVGSVAAARRARWTPARRLALALELLADPLFERLIGARVRFADLPAALPRILDAPATPPATIVTYGD